MAELDPNDADVRIERGEEARGFDVVNTRVFEVTRDRAFEAFSDPRHLARWWGPNGFENSFAEFDLRPGGMWRFTMRAPDGTEYPNESVFIEVVEPERIVFDHLEPGHRFRMTLTFEAVTGGTRLTWHMRFDDEDPGIRQFIIDANEQNFDRLTAELERMD